MYILYKNIGFLNIINVKAYVISLTKHHYNVVKWY